MKELRLLAWAWIVREAIHLLLALGATGLALWFLWELVAMYQ